MTHIELPHGWGKVPSLRATVAQDKNATGVELAQLWNYLKTSPLAGIQQDLPFAVSYKEGKGDDDEVRFLVGNHPHLLPETILDIVDSAIEGNSIFGLASNPSCPEDVLRKIRNWSGNSVINGEVVDSQHSPGWIREIHPDDDYYVKTKIAIHALTKPDVLKLLATDEHWAVRAAVAANIHSPVDVLVGLSKDKDHRVLWGLMSNLSTPADMGVEAFLKARTFFTQEEQRIRIPSKLLVYMLKNKFPEVHEGMPRDWLLGLLDSSIQRGN